MTGAEQNYEKHVYLGLRGSEKVYFLSVYNLVTQSQRRTRGMRLPGNLIFSRIAGGRRPNTGPGAPVVIGSFIDFRACCHAWGDLLFENNCSIRGFIQAPAGYLRRYYCPIRIPGQWSSDPVLICGLDGQSLALCIDIRWEQKVDSVHSKG